MSEQKYLDDILESQTLDPEGDEMKELRRHRDGVEKILRKKFADSSPTIRYGGSKAKGTMIREAYDLDVICYFDRDDAAAGETLKEIYENVEAALGDDYLVTRKASALRLKSRGLDDWARDFHIDVVPGRFIDDDGDDVFLYRSSGEKGRQKTNLEVHLKHVRESGVTDDIRLMKLWRARNDLSVKHFVLELLVIKLLEKKRSLGLGARLKHVWTELRDDVDGITVEDPANPNGNDLSELLNAAVRYKLSMAAARALESIEKEGWEGVFGPVPERPAKSRPPVYVPPRIVQPRPSFGED